jgi:hypothetical protein
VKDWVNEIGRAGSMIADVAECCRVVCGMRMDEVSRGIAAATADGRRAGIPARQRGKKSKGRRVGCRGGCSMNHSPCSAGCNASWW